MLMKVKVSRLKVELRFEEGYLPALPLDATRWTARDLVFAAMGHAWQAQSSRREHRREVGDRDLVVQARRRGPPPSEPGHWEAVGSFPFPELLAHYTPGRLNRLTLAAVNMLRSARTLACVGRIDVGLCAAGIG
jgi:hypothetical protein